MIKQLRQDTSTVEQCTVVKSPSRLEYCSATTEVMQPCYNNMNEEDTSAAAKKDGEEEVCSIEQDDATNDSRENLRKSESNYGVSREDIEKHAGKRLRDVANIFGISLSAMKKVCRNHGILRWPVRPINMLSASKVRKYRHSLYLQVAFDQSNSGVKPNSPSLSLGKEVNLDPKGEPSSPFSAPDMSSLDPKTS